MEIPTIIHQSWKDTRIPDDSYPHHWQQSWRQIHPDWQYILWTDDDNRELVRSKYPRFLDFYDNLDMGIKKADFCRFFYMHAFGGVYADLDFICLRDLTPILFNAAIVVGHLSQDNPYYKIPNAFIASAPGHEFWLTVAEDAMLAPEEEQGVEHLSGPFRLQWAMEKYQPRGLRILDPHLVYPIDWIHLTDWEGGVFFRKNEADLARNLRTMTLEEIQKSFPQSFAVTTWNHNW